MPTKKTSQLVKLDKSLIWHPFTQMKDWQRDDVVVIERGDGCYLIDTEGNRYLDGVSSLWCNVHGHRVKAIDQAVKKQLGRIAHSTFLGLSNVPAIQLAEKLIRIVPKGLKRVFYSDSGSEAVEIALKMAFQYWRNRGERKRTQFIRLSNSYHGDTIGSVSLGGISLFHEIFGPLLFKSVQVEAPYFYRDPKAGEYENYLDICVERLEKTLKKHQGETIALVMEPLMQGAAGMINQPKGYISRARELTNKYNTLLIFDEVATGFGRTGKWFAADHEKISPDILCVAKNLTGGYLPLAATITTEKIYRSFLAKHEEFKAFFHGHTFTANPLACSAAIANLELFEKQKTIAKLEPKIEYLSECLRSFWNLKAVGDIRQVGFMAGIELVKNRRTKEPFAPKEKIGIRVTKHARAKGVMIRPLGNVIVLMPPLAINVKELERLLSVVYESIEEITEE